MTRTRPSRKHDLRRSMDDVPTGGSRPSLCVAYFILSGTSGWALTKTRTSTQFAFGTFAFLFGHSIIGLFHTTHPEPPDILTKIFRRTSLIAEVAPLAYMNAELYLLYGFGDLIAYAHALSILLPHMAVTFAEDHTREVTDLTLLGHFASMAYLQFTKDTGVWTGGLLALTALNHFVFKQVCGRYDVPKIEVVTIGLSFFTVFALNCLRELRLL